MPRQADAETPEDLVERITGLLTTIDETGDVPDEIRERPGEFFRALHEAWYKNGGKAGGKPRNSIRRMRNEWLVKEKHVRSLHPKLTGQVKFDRHEGRTLIELFLSRWEYVGSRRKDDAVTPDGYVPFVSQDLDRLLETLLNAIFGKAGLDSVTTILLPTTEASSAEDATPVQPSERDYLSFIREVDALITISARQSVLGETPADGMRRWWQYVGQLSRDDQTKDNLFIWVVDIGSGQVEDEGSFAEYLNVGSLALHFSTLARFNSERDQEDSNIGPMGRRLSMPDDQQRLNLWQWFKEHATVVIRTRNETAIETIHREEDASLKTIRVKGLGLSAEHILPRTVPSKWADALKSFYGGRISDLADKTLAAACKKTTFSSQPDVLYRATSVEKNSRIRSESDFGEDAVSSFRTISLPAPGDNYDDACRLIYLASCYRLAKQNSTKEEKLAISYLHQLGFEVVEAEKFIRLFGNVKHAIDT